VNEMNIFTSNLLTMLTALPDWLFFTLGKWQVRRTQLQILRRIIRSNASTVYGRTLGLKKIDSYDAFRTLPLTEYDIYKNSIECILKGEKAVLTSSEITALLPTSGTTHGTKLIPFNGAVKKEFMRALNVWLFNFYLRCPAIMCGKQYWSMSPVTKYPDRKNGTLPVGFADDTGYFNRFQARMLANCFAAPLSLQLIGDSAAHEYLTLRFLLGSRDLAFVFIWSPTFLIAKLEHVQQYKENLLSDIRHGTISSTIRLTQSEHKLFAGMLHPDPERSDYLESIDFSDRGDWKRIWPDLKMISCWADSSSALFKGELEEIFPEAVIEEKGLVATEAVFTIPWWKGNSKPAAYRSHFYEFLETDSGAIEPLWKIKPGIRYAVLVTTSGGLYRYQMHDIVEVTGYIGRIPCLRFIGRENASVDLVGEKLTEETVRIFLESQSLTGNGYSFAMVAPTRLTGHLAYTLFIEPQTLKWRDCDELIEQFDEMLRENYHYRHARQLQQLHPPRLFIIEQGTGLASYLVYEEAEGKRAGDIKIRYLDSRFCWDEIFKGEFVTSQKKIHENHFHTT
jgi:hypothetical protein